MNIKVLTLTLLLSHGVYAESELQDMSDPLAVYTQAGLGTTNKGLNLKIGKSYDPGVPKTMAMNLVELKGFFGDALGWDYSDQKDNEIDSFRFRNFKVEMTKGRGSQLDINYNFQKSIFGERTGDISYSLIQALPKMSVFNLYPLAGFGVNYGKNVIQDDGSINSGFSVYGLNVLVGLYGKITITEKLWLNYNPFWLLAVSGSDLYENNAYGDGEDNILLHEFITSYQFTQRFNLRYFANWNNNVDILKGDHRLEFNYQF